MPRVIFKHEDEANGQAIGPVLVVSAQPEPNSLGRPYQPACACSGAYGERVQRANEINEWGYPLCPDCGGELQPPWVTRAEAEAVAQEHGVELEEV